LRVCAIVAYDGSKFNGFQRQKHTKNTIEETISQALIKLKITSQLLYSGRTDAKVHSTGQVISFEVPPFWQDLKKLKHSLNKNLKAIFIKNIMQTSPNFHPRFMAKARVYRYVFCIKKDKIFLNDYVCFLKKIDIQKLNQVLKLFEGEHDFVFFRKTGSDEKTTIRKIKKAYAYKYQDLIIINIEANAFLRSQVRLIVGSAVSFVEGKLSLEDLKEQINAKKKTFSKPIIPNGLYLAKVKY